MDNIGSNSSNSSLVQIFFASVLAFLLIRFLLNGCSIEGYAGARTPEEYAQPVALEENIQKWNQEAGSDSRQVIGVVNKPHYGPKQFNPDLPYAVLYDKEPFVEYHNYGTPLCQ